MKLPAVVRSVVSNITRSAPAARASAPRAQPALDGFDTRPPPKGGTNEAFVKNLYKQLLGREPDAAGLAAHLKGLEGGASRKDILNTFLESAELKAKQGGASVNGGPDLSPTNRSFGTPLRSLDDPNTVSFVNTPENKNVAPPSVFAKNVHDAIDRVLASGVGLEPGTTHITDFDKYHQAVCQEMLNAGYQAHYDGEELAVSLPGDKHSEQFDISTWKGEVRRFYASTQTPSTFE